MFDECVFMNPLCFSSQSCCRRLYNWLKVAPYRPDQQVEDDDDLMDESQGKGIRVLGVAYAPSRYLPYSIFCIHSIYLSVATLFGMKVKVISLGS